MIKERLLVIYRSETPPVGHVNIACNVQLSKTILFYFFCYKLLYKLICIKLINISDAGLNRTLEVNVTSYISHVCFIQNPLLFSLCSSFLETWLQKQSPGVCYTQMVLFQSFEGVSGAFRAESAERQNRAEVFCHWMRCLHKVVQFGMVLHCCFL